MKDNLVCFGSKLLNSLAIPQNLVELRLASAERFLCPLPEIGKVIENNYHCSDAYSDVSRIRIKNRRNICIIKEKK